MNVLTVFVDPLDGTREFVEGRLPNVQSLIGVTYKGTPLMGAVGLPFPTTNENIVKLGRAYIPKTESPKPQPPDYANKFTTNRK